MKLYYTKGACSFAERIIINEIGLTCEFEAVDLKTKKTASGKDFLQINDKGAVPTLITDDNQTLTENAIILQYLAENTNNSELLPPLGNFNRYKTLGWVNYVATELHKGFGPLFNPAMPQEVKEKITLPLLNKKFAYIDNHLQNNQFLMGEQFTLGDAYLFVILMWSSNFKISLTEFSNLSRYFADLKSRQSIQQSLEEEGITLS